MDDELRTFGSESEDESGPLTAEDARLEALLAEIPRRSCPQYVRQNVIARLRQETVMTAADAEKPRARVVSLWMRRRVLVALEAAAFLAIAVVALKAYYAHRGRYGAELLQPPAAVTKKHISDESRAAVQSFGFKAAEKAVEELSLSRPAAPSPKAAEPRDRELGRLATKLDRLEERKSALSDGYPISADAAKAAEWKYGATGGMGPARAREATIGEVAREEVKSKMVKALAETPEKALPAEKPGIVGTSYETVAPMGSAKPTAAPTVLETAPRKMAAAKPVATGAAIAPATQPAIEEPEVAPPKEPATRLRGLAEESERFGKPTARDEASVSVGRRLQIVEIAASPSVQAKIVALNVIKDIQAPESEALSTIQDQKATTWTAFSQRALDSFGQMIAEFSGTINGSEEVLLMPGSRRALMVECSVPANRASALMSAVNQKRVVAVASADRPGRGRVGWILWSAGPDVYDNFRRASESDLKGQISGPTTNFYVQSPPANIAQNYVNQRAQLGQRLAPSQQMFGGGGGYGGFGRAGGPSAGLQPSSQQAATAIAGPGRQQFGQQIDRDRAQQTGQTVLYFVLEPDQLPIPATVSK
ncbi:hypothetical protein FJY63_11205 [Candidatus Sumerlaeota bacterium]|nr:hypothetical protein [Candidatus Sumerlaeota bacterium]